MYQDVNFPEKKEKKKLKTMLIQLFKFLIEEKHIQQYLHRLWISSCRSATVAYKTTEKRTHSEKANKWVPQNKQ